MTQIGNDYTRFAAFRAVGPRFFHITSSNTDGLYVGELQLDSRAEFPQVHLPDCKPGIWASSYRQASRILGTDSAGRDAIVRFVEHGQFDLSLPVESWSVEQSRLGEKYGHFDASQFTWTRNGSIGVDGGLVNILAVAYLRPASVSKVVGWNLEGAQSLQKEMETYLTTLAWGGSWAVTGDKAKDGYTVGGMSFHTDDGSIPLWIARDENGQVIAARVYIGDSEEEDLAMIGCEQHAQQDDQEALPVKSKPLTVGQQELQDMGLRAMLLEQQAIKLLQDANGRSDE